MNIKFDNIENNFTDYFLYLTNQLDATPDEEIVSIKAVELRAICEKFLDLDSQLSEFKQEMRREIANIKKYYKLEEKYESKTMCGVKIG